MSISTQTRRFVHATIVAAMLMLMRVAEAALPGYEEDVDADKARTPDVAVVLPPMPKTENLLEFEASAASSNRYFIDAPSITIENDGTVRYTLVVKGSGGAENISYEGIRCDTLEQKAYAFGRRNGAWSNARESAWRKIQYKTGNRQYAVLYSDYLCPDGKPIRSSKEAIARFKYGVPYGEPPRTRN